MRAFKLAEKSDIVLPVSGEGPSVDVHAGAQAAALTGLQDVVQAPGHPNNHHYHHHSHRHCQLSSLSSLYITIVNYHHYTSSLSNVIIIIIIHHHCQS